MARALREASTLIIATKSSNSKAIDLSLPMQNFIRFQGKYPDQQNIKLLMLKRSKSMGFMANAYVFPGGIVDKADFSSKWWDVFRKRNSSNDLKLLTEKISSPSPGILQASHYKWIDPEIEDGINNGLYLPPDLALRLTAIRETFEECGVLIARPNTVSLGSPPTVQKVENSAEWQSRIQNNAAELINLCLELDCSPDVWSLYPWSNWITPANKKPRFDSIFFMCLLNNKPEVMYSSEVSNHLWCTPQQYFAKVSLQEVMLPPPQVYELSRLANFGELSNLEEFLKTRFNKPMAEMLPVLKLLKDGLLLALPGDELYPVNPDFLGQNPTAEIDKTVNELEKSSKKFNRILMNEKNEWTLQCNIDLDSGHMINPVALEGKAPIAHL